MKWFRLESQSGIVVRVSVMLMGLPVFAQMLLANALSEAIDLTTLTILQATAEGNPPSVWSQAEYETTFPRGRSALELRMKFRKPRLRGILVAHRTRDQRP